MGGWPIRGAALGVAVWWAPTCCWRGDHPLKALMLNDSGGLGRFGSDQEAIMVLGQTESPISLEEDRAGFVLF